MAHVCDNMHVTALKVAPVLPAKLVFPLEPVRMGAKFILLVRFAVADVDLVVLQLLLVEEELLLRRPVLVSENVLHEEHRVDELRLVEDDTESEKVVVDF